MARLEAFLAPFLTIPADPDVCRRWRMGYLPRDTGGEDKSGGTMRGKVVYPYLSDSGEVLTWFGRDPEFEDKHKAWEGTDKSEREPEKFHFVKGFHRGLELFGQHALHAVPEFSLIRGFLLQPVFLQAPHVLEFRVRPARGWRVLAAHFF